MTTTSKAVPVTPAKKLDLPPKGNRNPDPITNEAGAHPIETGVGAAGGVQELDLRQEWSLAP